MCAAGAVNSFAPAQVRCIAVIPKDAINQLADLATSRGLRVFPCRARDKRPLIEGWQTKASSNLSTILDSAEKYPGCNWGVATGPCSRVFVLDVDGPAGRSALAELERQHGRLPVTLTSRTGRGEHRWFKYPNHFEVRGSVGKLGNGLDIRGAGGYVVVPPSTHESGHPYEWVNPAAAIEDAPNWLLDLVSTQTRKNGNQAKPHADPPAQRRSAKNETAPEPPFNTLVKGQRNDGLFRYGAALRRKGYTREQIELQLLEMNERRCIPPLAKKEVLTIAASAAQYPVGGPDPLESAWEAVLGEQLARGYPQFIALCRHLQRERGRFSIALPEVRIGTLMGVDRKQVTRWRKRAVRDGWLHPAEKYIAHRRAWCFFFKEIDTE